MLFIRGELAGESGGFNIAGFTRINERVIFTMIIELPHEKKKSQNFHTLFLNHGLSGSIFRAACMYFRDCVSSLRTVFKNKP